MRKQTPGFSRLGLKYNPFEPAASGPTVAADEIWIPQSWQRKLEQRMEQTAGTTTPKAVALVGEYGSGKTVLLRWLERSYFSKHRIQAFYFENPGVKFYDLANNWFRQVGRFELAKALVELLGPETKGLHGELFETDFLSWLGMLQSDKRRANEVTNKLQDAILKKNITEDEEIARRMAKLIMDTPSRPYFEYKDFVAGRTGSLVAQGQEAKYFKAFIRATRQTAAVDCIAFLVDEFEEISLGKSLTTREAHGACPFLSGMVVASLVHFMRSDG
jgi:hypothetical protein